MESLKTLYKIGRGPSSSHTMGPEKACKIFKAEYGDADKYVVTLYGSLSATGKGHLTDKVVEETLGKDKTEVIFGDTEGNFFHPNTMKIQAEKNDEIVAEKTFYSIGGGEIKIEGEAYDKAKCVRDGLSASGVLPGGLNTERKAKTLFEQYALNESPVARQNRIVCAYAFACSENNAGGGEVVTAPTCGSCGVLPAVLKYLYDKNDVPEKELLKALAVAGVIGNIVRTNASVSGAECGCQAEVGVACSMASAAVASLYGMDIDQIEYASEIAIEHHLGLTCDPICGLVQIPCIERNAVAALRALNEVTLATFLTGSRKITFDEVVTTMYETGRDLGNKYRETSKGGLAKLRK